MPKIRVLLQAGHIAPREPGFEAGTGTTREQEYSAAVRKLLHQRFAADGRFDITLAPGDIPDGWRGDVALFLHADGSANKNAKGFSFGWDINNPGRAPRLAKILTRRFVNIGHPGGHHTDNYTGGLRHYYGYRRINAPLELLIEIGFMTNPTEQQWIFRNLERIADEIYAGVLEELEIKAIAAVKVARGPLTLRTVAGEMIGSGYLNTPVTVQRAVKALKAAGKRAPWTAKVDGKVIASGRFWPLGAFNRAVAYAARTGKRVVISDAITITRET